MFTQKSISSFIISMLILSSCGPSMVQIGNINMVSTRNIESNANYKLLRAYAGSEKSNFRDTKAASINAAIDNVVRQVAGGEYMKNIKCYKIGEMYAVEGDVWGIVENSQEMRGFKLGQYVQFKTYDNGFNRQYKGKITELKTDKVAVVQAEGTDKFFQVPYEKMVKISE